MQIRALFTSEKWLKQLVDIGGTCQCMFKVRGQQRTDYFTGGSVIIVLYFGQKQRFKVKSH